MSLIILYYIDDINTQRFLNLNDMMDRYDFVLPQKCFASCMRQYFYIYPSHTSTHTNKKLLSFHFTTFFNYIQQRVVFFSVTQKTHQIMTQKTQRIMTQKTHKIMELEMKMKNKGDQRKTCFCNSKQKNFQGNPCFFKYFRLKFIIINLRLVKVLLKLKNKTKKLHSSSVNVVHVGLLC